MKTRYQLAGVMLAAALLQQPVAAQSVARASVSDFHFSLRDLDTGDGIAPALIFTANQDQLASQLHAYVYAGSLATQQDQTSRSEFAYETISLGLHGADSSVSLSVSGSDLFSTVLRSTLSASGDGANWNRAFGNASVDNIAFRLTPHTELLLSANAELWAGTPGAGIARAGEGVSAVGMLALSFHAGNDWSSRYAYQNVHAETQWDGSDYRFGGLNMGSQLPISLSFANAGANYGEGLLSLSATTSGNGWTAMPAPVPEPSGIGMLVAGLGLLGLCGGRRGHDNRICLQQTED